MVDKKIKVTKESGTGYMKDWTDVTIKANGREFQMSVNQDGHILIHSSLSDMPLHFSSFDKNPYKIVKNYPDGTIYKMGRKAE